jgi:hypothetical protein
MSQTFKSLTSLLLRFLTIFMIHTDLTEMYLNKFATIEILGEFT